MNDNEWISNALDFHLAQIRELNHKISWHERQAALLRRFACAQVIEQSPVIESDPRPSPVVETIKIQLHEEVPMFKVLENFNFLGRMEAIASILEDGRGMTVREIQQALTGELKPFYEMSRSVSNYLYNGRGYGLFISRNKGNRGYWSLHNKIYFNNQNLYFKKLVLESLVEKMSIVPSKLITNSDSPNLIDIILGQIKDRPGINLHCLHQKLYGDNEDITTKSKIKIASILFWILRDQVCQGSLKGSAINGYYLGVGN